MYVNIIMYKIFSDICADEFTFIGGQWKCDGWDTLTSL